MKQFDKHMRFAPALGGLAAVAMAVLGAPALGDIAAHVDGGSGGTPVADSVHGWEFTVNADITVTHLGLWDQDLNGFTENHDIGLFRVSDGALLTSGTMSAGTGDPLLDGFRYIDVTDVGITTGENYVLSYYTDRAGTSDFVITNGTGETFAPEVNWVQGRWGTGSGGLVMAPNGTSADRWGPNFQFNAGGGGYTLRVSGQCPGTVTVAWANATPGVLQAIVFGNNLGSTTIPQNFPCSGTVLGIAGNVQLVDPPGFFNTGSGNGSISGRAGSSACGHYLQLVEGGSCNTSNPAQIP